MLNRFLFLFIISCSLGFAHSLKVFAKASDNALEIKGYYYGGSACKGCVVELRDENGAFASLELDEQGRVNTALPNKISFKIAVIAAGGHLKEIEFKNPNFAQNQPDEKSSVFLEFLKGFGSILAIFIIFSVIYFAKKKR